MTIKEFCKNKVSTTKVTQDPKTNSTVRTYTTQRKCSNSLEAIQEEEEDENKDKDAIEEKKLLGTDTEEDKEDLMLVKPEDVEEKEEEEKKIMEGIKKMFSRFL